MERALAYIRVSTDRQATDGTSLQTQQRRVDDYVALKSYELDRLFVDDGESAKTPNRPGLQELLVYAKKNKGKHHVLVFPKIDRFARYSEDYFFLKRYFRDLGIRVESTDERFDDSPSGRYMETMLAATAQYDNEIRSERSKGGMVEAALAGRWVGGVAPVGYRNTRYENRATIEPDPVKGPLISEAFERLAWRGFRSTDVRLWLARRGIAISRSNFHRAIHRTVYVGRIDRFGVKRQGAPPFLPLVSEATFFKAQEAIERRELPKVYQRDREDFPLRGTARCICGSFLMAGWSQGRSRRYGYYRCKNCSKVNMPSAGVEAAFVDLLRLIKRRYTLTDGVRRDLLRRVQDEQAKDRQREEQLRREVASLIDVQKALALKSAQGIVPDAIAKEHFQELEQKIGQKKVELKECQAGDAPWERILDFTGAFLPKLERRWLDGDLATKKHLQAFFFERGATVLKSPKRTAFEAPPTGLRRAPSSPLSHSVRCKLEFTNPVARRNRLRNGPAESKRFHLRLFEEFGQGPGAETV